MSIYPTFSYAGSESATYTEFEFVPIFNIGPFEIENRTVMNGADLPGSIFLGPTNPGDTAAPGRESGFGDVLNGSFFSLRGHSEDYHLGIGPVMTFPTASEDHLGSRKYTGGPGMHFSTEIDRLTCGFFIWQSWSYHGPSDAKRVNQLFGKPFFIYKMTDDWHLIYIPLGLSLSWDKPGGENLTVPLGGGLRKLMKIGNQTVGFQSQAFSYVARKSTDPEWELRFTIEFLFDE